MLQVQIDQVTGSRVFIGACASSIFIRNCSNCTFYSACRQLRLRDVKDCKFYIYAMAEVHIEYSSGVSFAPFNGGYPEQEKHLKQCKLDVDHNLWYDIFDHNDQEKTRKNWSLIPSDSYEEPWFPAGPCTPALKLTQPGSVAREDGQVGQSFGVDQMVADQASLPRAGVELESKQQAPADTLTGKKPKKEELKVNEKKVAAPEKKSVMESPRQQTSLYDKKTSAQIQRENDLKPKVVVTISPVDKLSLEIALLIVSAMNKGIDVSVWLGESIDLGRLPVADFEDKLISLALTVGIEEDIETKKELDIATSKASLATAIEVCSCGESASLTPLVNVTVFLNLCQSKVDKYMRDLEGMNDEIALPVEKKTFEQVNQLSMSLQHHCLHDYTRLPQKRPPNPLPSSRTSRHQL